MPDPILMKMQCYKVELEVGIRLLNAQDSLLAKCFRNTTAVTKNKND